MKKRIIFCLTAVFALILMLPSGVIGAPQYVTETAYEFDGTKDGWISLDSNASINAATVDGNTLKLSTSSSHMVKDIVYNGEANFGKMYTFSFDLEVGNNDTSKRAQILFNNSGSGTNNTWNNHRLNITPKKSDTGLPSVTLVKESNYNERNNTIATADFSNATDEYKNSIDNAWHVEIVYDNGDVAVWLKPLSYSGEAIKVIDYDETSSSCKTGRIGIRNDNLYSKCNISNMKVTVTKDVTFLEAYKLSGDSTNWTLTGGANISSGTISNNWSNLNTSAYYRGHWASGTYKFTVTSKNDGGAAANLNYIYFNYKDGKNYYRINQPGMQTGGDTLSIKLYEVVDGTSTLIGTYEAPHANRSFAYTIIQQDGKIKITYTSGSQSHEPFEEFDAKLSEGFIGVGTASTSGAFSGIALYGKADPVWLAVEDCDVANNSENIPISDFSCTFDFNYDLDILTVTKDAVFVRVKDSGEKLPESAYEIEYSAANSPDCVTVKIKETLEYKTAYEVVIGSALHSKEYGSSLNVKEHVVGFTTIPPQFDVNPVLTSGGADVENVFDIAGQDVDFNVSLTNSGSSDQPFIASVCVYDADGKLVAGKFYKGTVSKGATDSTTVTGSVTVPSGISEGAKIIIYVWDKPETMNVLYKCIEY